MAMKKGIAVMMSMSVIFPMAILANETNYNKWSFHVNELKGGLVTSWWKQFHSDDSWHIRCIFVDMDGDSIEEMLAITTSEEDRMGDYWKLWKYDDAGKFGKVSFSGDIYFSCHWYSFYKVSYSNRTNAVVGFGMNANIEEPCGDGDRRIVKSTPDCKFVVMPENNFMLSEIEPDVDASFRREDVVGIERLYPEWYFGFDFKPPRDVPHSVYTQRMPYTLPRGDLRHGGGIACPKDFDAFVAEYRQKVKLRTGWEKVVVYAVFLDVDNDGDGDCYVSSDAEQLQNGVFRWTLYLRHGERFSAGDQEVFPVAERKDLGSLPPAVNAGKMAFCRIVRYDAAPTFLILDRLNEGQPVVRNAMLDCQSHGIEKLDCVEFGDDR